MRSWKIYTLFLFGLGLLMGACRAPGVSIMVSAIRPLDADCRVDREHSIARGALNINASSQYLLAVELENILEGVDIEGAGGQLLASGKENRVILTEWTRQYFIYGAEGTSRLILEESEPFSGVLEPNAETLLRVPLSMVGPLGAGEIKRVLLQAGAGASVGTDMVVRFKIRGKIMSSGKKLETPSMEFPIFVYLGDELPLCAEGERLAPVGPCALHGGQDAFVPICCVLGATDGECVN
ncbi:MAG: hypothetical protein FWG75_06710 [Cystobacterineae bacterium]|nr:hypothetical protein [Cystobacterineae bacterium]